eukprot:390202_1
MNVKSKSSLVYNGYGEELTSTSICNRLHQRHQEKQKSQIHLDVETNLYGDHGPVAQVYLHGDHADGDNIIRLPFAQNSMILIGEAILKLSLCDQYDRIIIVNIGTSQAPFLLDWMKPLLSDNFKCLIELTNDDGFEAGMLDFSNAYNILCDMISRDKLIKVPLTICYNNSDNELQDTYDFINNEVLIDTKKLMNAIKSTNALKSIVVIQVPGYMDDDRQTLCFYYHTEQIFKEAISLNLSVTELLITNDDGNEVDIFSKWSQDDVEEHYLNEDLKQKYKQWWPIIKQRNEEAQMCNKILVENHMDNSKWNENKCPIQIAEKVLQKHFPMLPPNAHDPNGDKCFCLKCHTLRNDKIIYQRGQPPQKYALPIEWVRFGLTTNQTVCAMNNVWDGWHVAFHGTTKEIIPQIFQSGQLLKPGDITISGKQLGIREGHIRKPFERYNKYTKNKEIFDPNQIYLSPSIKYSGEYAKWSYCSHPEDKSRTIKVQYAFQARIRPGSYGIGQETVGAAQSIDSHFSNNSLEWYTKENVAIVLHGLLVRIKEVNTSLKIKYKQNNDDDEKTFQLNQNMDNTTEMFE